ncbi:hypothetical protein CYMTET_22835 [Cymbomonas tetramitiformis]|uniref:Attractin/MKLN-like beta-propeller domain-containing protein n=1 Tax=Cymbomonas tetramitiformis TaxID=36881 RepID=A0AAE0FZF8_9CHLO|nr:hypothetical protein CYMTET_22835 [Cymbomonas tetramitiformis]
MNRLYLALALCAVLAGQVAGQTVYETVLRFDCKLQIQFVQEDGHFVLDDGTKYFTTTTFEGYIWHHVIASIDEDGFGVLAVDGEIMELARAVDVTNVTLGLQEPLGFNFTTSMYPNRCIPPDYYSELQNGRRRHLLDDHLFDTAPPAPEAFNGQDFETRQEEDMDKMMHYVVADYPPPIGYQETNDTETANNLPCNCSFFVGTPCEDGSTKGLEGFIDEVAVWNLAVPQEHLKYTLFHMPAFKQIKELEAPRGRTIDLAVGRVLYVRWNNPCLEAPVQAPPAPPPPSPQCDNEGCFASRRRLSQISGTQDVRVQYVTDHAGYAGGRETEDGSYVLDADNDQAVFVDFPYNSRYVYSGVPWAAPYVGDLAFSQDSMDSSGGQLPLDGGVLVTVSGVGFARSPFLKCAVDQPDPAMLRNNYPGPREEFKSKEYEPSFYNSFFWEGLPASMDTLVDAPYNFDASPDYLVTDATAQFLPWEGSPRIHWSYNAEWVTDGDPYGPTRDGLTNPFVENDYDPYNLDFVYGYYEVLTCTAPASAFPSDEYYFGVTNNGGLLGSPPFAVTIQEYAGEFKYVDGGTMVMPNGENGLTRAMGNTFTISCWLYLDTPTPTELQTLFKLTHADASTPYTGVFINGTSILPYTNGDNPEYEAATDLTVQEWHFIALVITESPKGQLWFYVDGETKLADGDEGVQMIPFSNSPVDFHVGTKLEGKIDELKVWNAELTLADLNEHHMFHREDPDDLSDNLLANFRFNKDFTDSVGGFTASITGTVGLVPIAAPWEPSIIYAINDVPFAEIPERNLYKTTIAGGEPVKLKPSEHAEMMMGSHIGNADLDRVDDLRINSRKYLSFTPNPELTTIPISASETEVICMTPEASEPHYSLFTVGLGPVFNAQPFEFTERALYCDGHSSYVSADGVAAALNATAQGYSFSFWVFPEHLMAEEVEAKVAMRRLLQEGLEKPFKSIAPFTATTILAFETATGGNKALLVYDGHRFHYYDDNILDVTTFTEDGSAPNEWHKVTVTVEADGEGNLYVDNKPREHFTTRLKPDPTGTFSLCQDYLQMGDSIVASSFFAGKVDSVGIYDMVVPIEVYEHHVMSFPAPGAGLVAFFDFKLGSEVSLPEVSGIGGDLMGNASLIPTTVPWYPPHIIHIEPMTGDASAHEQVDVYGTNFAASQWEMLLFEKEGEEAIQVRRDAALPGVVSEEVGIIVTTPPVTDDCSLVMVNGTNDAVNIGNAVEFSYNTTVPNLEKGLIGYYTFDLVDLDAKEPLEFYDSVGGNNFMYYPEYSIADRDNFEHSAIIFGSGLEGGVPKLKTPLNELSDTLTVCWWVSIDMEVLQNLYEWAIELALDAATFAQTESFPTLSQEISQLSPGGWKMLTWIQTPEDDVPQIYSNFHLISPDAVAHQYLQRFFTPLLTEGHLSCNNELNHMVCQADSMWVYNRALKPCEVKARYFTQEFSLNFQYQYKPGDLMPVLHPGVTGSLPDSLEHLEQFTAEAWIYLFESHDIIQYIMHVEKGFDLSLVGNAVSFAVYRGCECAEEPCFQYYEHTSWKSKVARLTWSHIGVVYDGYRMLFYVDGVMTDMKLANETGYDYTKRGNYPSDEPGYDFAAMSPQAVHIKDAVLTVGKHFDGLIYDARLSTDVRSSLEVKDGTTCPTKNPRMNSVYFEMDEGHGNQTFSFAKDAEVHITSNMWYNASYDDPTDAFETEVMGNARFELEAGRPGMINIVSKTRCGKKRVFGGDSWVVSMLLEQDRLYPEKADVDDGNYPFYYWAGARKLNFAYETIGEGFPCGNYSTTVELEGEVVYTFGTSIFPSDTNRTETYIVGGTPTEGPFAVLNTFTIQANDSFACFKWDAADLDRLSVSFTGPYDMEADIQALGMGQYLVSFVPEVPGVYHVKVLMDGEPIKDGIFCYTVTRGGSALFNGQTSVVVQEDTPGQDTQGTELDLAYSEVTIEAWIQIQATADGYVLFKGKPSEVGTYAKGYEISIISSQLKAEVYCGHGHTRSVSYDISGNYTLNSWMHISAVYSGFDFTLYLNGIMAAVERFPDVRGVKVNMYDHPLVIGYQFLGLIDEVTLWKVARSQEEIQTTMYCPPMNTLNHVAAYFNFNEGVGDVSIGHGYLCAPLRTDCLRATSVNFGPEGTTALVASGVGVAAPSMHFSNHSLPQTIITAGDSSSPYYTAPIYQITARDKCGYRYNEGTMGTFTSSVLRFHTQYENEGELDGTMYPIVVDDEEVNNMDVTPAGGICPGMGLGDGPTTGDLYNASLSAVTKVGTYNLTIFADGLVMNPVPYPLLVVPNVPRTFSFEGLNGNSADSAAGVPTTKFVKLLDEFGNTCVRQYMFSVKLTLTGVDYNMSYTVHPENIMYNPDTNVYTYFYILGVQGVYEETLSMEGMEDLTLSTTVGGGAQFQKLAGMGAVPPEVTRFEHASVLYRDDLYVFGGASRDKEYLNDIWKLSNVVSDDFAFKKDIFLNSEVSQENVTVELYVNTKELIDAGVLNMYCTDLVFHYTALPREVEPFAFYMDPYPGCYNEATLFLVRLPYVEAGETNFTMIYHNPPMMDNPFSEPEEVFLFYEGFEHQEHKFQEIEACGGAVPAAPANVTSEYVATGKGALHMVPGGPAVLSAELETPKMGHFKMRSWLWDAGTEASAFYMSPNFGHCRMELMNSKMRLPEGYGPLEATSVAVGTFSLSNRRTYCAASPWQKSGVSRTGTWHRLEVTSTLNSTLEVYVDGELVKSEDGDIVMERVLLSGGYGVDGHPHTGLAATHAYWDDVSVLELVPVVATAAPMADDVHMALHLNRRWSRVPVKGSRMPAPRYSHSAVLYDHKMIIFGGERSSHSFGDTWEFHFETGMWHFIQPGKALYVYGAGYSSPAPRFDHSAAVDFESDTMVIYGGRSGKTIMGDAWAMNLKEGREWRLLTPVVDPTAGPVVDPVMGLRFGHTASIVPGSSSMMVFGGYAAETGFSDGIFDCDLKSGVCTDLKVTCEEAGSSFPYDSVHKRYGHTSFADENYLYIYGGSNLDHTSGFNIIHTLSMHDKCAWSTIDGNDVMGRYEHTMVAGNGRMIIHGGHFDGVPSPSTYFIPVGRSVKFEGIEMSAMEEVGMAELEQLAEIPETNTDAGPPISR